MRDKKIKAKPVTLGEPKLAAFDVPVTFRVVGTSRANAVEAAKNQLVNSISFDSCYNIYAIRGTTFGK